MTDEKQKMVFAKNLNRYISLNQKQQKEVAEAIGEKPTTLNMWCSGNSFPGVGKIQKLADYFRIGKTDLLDEKESVSENMEIADAAMNVILSDKRFSKIIIGYGNLPVEKKDLICDFFEKFIL